MSATRGAPTFIDPRTNPKPPSIPRPFASSGTEVEELLRLCRDGQIYAVEAWIAAGKPIQAERYIVGARPYSGSPARIALETGQRDLLRLLLCNGYQPARDEARPLDHALRERQWDAVSLLLRWGADPRSVDVEAVLNSYRADLFEHFWEAGADFQQYDILAYALGEHSSNRPLYGWARKHQHEPVVKRALALALVHAIDEGKDRAVYLTRWAGADPRLKVPSLRWKTDDVPDEDQDLSTAIEAALTSGGGRFLRKLGPDPAIDDFDALWAQVSDPDAVDYLITLQPPRDWSAAILRNLSRITYQYGSDSRDASRRCLLRIGFHGGRLTTATPQDIADVRRNFVRLREEDIQVWMLWWLKDERRCDASIYKEFVRTGRMREILAGLAARRR